MIDSYELIKEIKMEYTVSQLAATLDHSLLHPTITGKKIEEDCRFADEYQVASVCVQPAWIPLAASCLKGSSVAVGTVIGFPQGANSTRVKVYEAENALSDGALELDMVINIGKLLSGDIAYVSEEIRLLNQVAVSGGGLLKVIFENGFLDDDSLKIELCRICNEHRVAYAKTSTGYAFVKQEGGAYKSYGATDHDLLLMRQHCDPEVQIKAAGGVRTLERAIEVLELGVKRIGCTASKAILDKLS